MVGYFQEKRYEDIELMPGVILKRSAKPVQEETLIESLLKGREMSIKLIGTWRKNKSQGKKPNNIQN